MYEPMFVPPRQNDFLIRVAHTFLPLIANAAARIRDVRVEPEDFARLQELEPQRAILSPNHPTGSDPIVLFWLSRMLGQPFHYLAAREVLVGFKGWMMNQVGTYSVIRGVPDRESLRATRRLLAELDRKVVIFPEGEIYEHNDTLLAFQSGVPQLGFWALDDLEKSKKRLAMPIVPIAVKYRCIDSPRQAIENSLADLERALSLAAAPNLTHYQRLLRVGDRVLQSLEREERLKPEEGADLPQRIRCAKQHMLQRVAERIGTQIDERQQPADQLHALFNDLKQWVGMHDGDFSEYDERLYQRKMEVAGPLFRDLERLQNFLAFTGDYIAAEHTAERFMDVLGRLEEEVLGEVRHRVPREALVRIAPPIRLEERYDDYRKNKRQVVGEVTRQMESTIRDMLQELSARATPISLEA
jgi:hypothetical protein